MISLSAVFRSSGCVLCLGLMSCGGGTKAISPSSPISPLVADFALSVLPPSIPLSQGGTGQLTVTASSLNGFDGNISVALTGLPEGINAQPDTLDLVLGRPQTITLTASRSAATGIATLALTATTATLSHSASVTATVLAPTLPTGDFSLSATPVSVELVEGGSGQQITVNAVPIDQFGATVIVGITDLPSGVTVYPTTLTLTPGTSQSLTLTAAAITTPSTRTITLTGKSGALMHTASVALEVSPPGLGADYSLVLLPTSLVLVSGASGAAVDVLANAVNSSSGPVSISITGLPSGVTAYPATLTLTPGVMQRTTLSAGPTAAASMSLVTFTATSGNLNRSATFALTVQPARSTGAPDVTTYHYNVARDGLNAKEIILTTVNVNSTQFGAVGFMTVDAKVDAEPLYIANVSLGGKLRNVLYVATEHDSIYAFDADSGTQLWKVSIIGSGETTSDDRGCNQISPEIGITSTPVIDRTQGPNGTIFTVGMTKDTSGNYHHRLHALDLITGAEATGSPTEVAATYPGTGSNSANGTVVFDASLYAERAALLLLDGNIYTAWTSHCDDGPYTGWVIAYSESTIEQTKVLNLTPNGKEGSIWMSGDGLAADANGYIYFLDANGTFDTTFDAKGFPAKGDYGNAMVKLSTSGALAIVDYFETYNTNTESNGDVDLGSGGELLLPDQVDASGGVHHLIVGAGKDTNIYLADRDNMGKFNPANNPEDSNLYQEIKGQLVGKVFSTPAYFNGVLYYGPAGAPLKAFPLTDAKLAVAPSSQSSRSFAYPGTTPGISANGTANGIVWAVESGTGSHAVLHAYEAADLNHELYNSTQAANNRDSFGNGNKFITPLIVNGKVYIGTPTGVAVFGLLP